MRKSFKKKASLLSLIFLSMVLIPLLATSKKSPNLVHGLFLENSKLDEESKTEATFCFLKEDKNEVLKVPEKEFLYGAVAAEMPVSFEPEALKAQAVAAYTYFCRKRDLHLKNENKNCEYEFTMNGKLSDGAFYSIDRMKERWKENFEENFKKIKNAVDSVYGEALKYEKDYALTVFHAMSSGKTEKCVDVFGGDYKYLTNVESEEEKQVIGYETKVEISKEEFENLLLKKFENIKLSGTPNSWCKNITRTDGGAVKEIEICEEKIKGTDMRWIFGLRSANFDLEFKENKFIFTVHGYGHGVGMSQHGANIMAKHGSNYKQILERFYPGTVLESVL